MLHRGACPAGQPAGRRGARALSAPRSAAGLHRDGRGVSESLRPVLARRGRCGARRRAARGPVSQSAVSHSLTKTISPWPISSSSIAPPRSSSKNPYPAQNHLHRLAAHAGAAQSRVRLRRPADVSGRDLGPACFHAGRARPATSLDVLVLYSRTWEPGWGVLQWPAIRDFLEPLLRI